jgi:nardilysin
MLHLSGCHAGQGGRLYMMPAVRKGHHLTVSFQLPSLFSAYREKAEDYISHLVGHEGKGSLLSALKAAGWASAISAGINDSGYERNTALFVFEVTMTLTDAGLAAAPGLSPPPQRFSHFMPRAFCRQ